MFTIDSIYLREINLPLARPFETSFGLTTGRRILLVEIESDGLTAWGECVAGEHPYFSDEMIDTAWMITESELAPRLLEAELSRQSHGEGRTRECGMGDDGATGADLAGESAWRNARGDSLRCVDWHSAFDRAADGRDRDGARRWLSAH